jgi:hypothetical protein
LVVLVGAVGCASDPPAKTGNASAAAGGAAPASATTTASGGSAAPAASTSTSTSGGGAPAAAGGGAAATNDNCSALPLSTNPDDVISTFEDGTGAVMQVAGRGGGFYMYNDGTGMQTPPTGALPPATMVNRCMSKFALCMSGKNFMTWGAGMGTDFAPLGPAAAGSTMGAKMTYDASMYKGVAFWAKSNAAAVSVRVSFKDADTAPEGGMCDAMATSGATACNDDWGKAVMFTPDWAPVTIMFADLKQAAWGKAFPEFLNNKVYSIQFQVSQGVDFDVCIDDLQFVR